jgi:hypothetical protein
MKHREATSSQNECAIMEEAGCINLPLEPEPPTDRAWVKPAAARPGRKPKQQEPETIAAKRTRIAKMYACLGFPNGIPESWVRV